MLRVIQEIRPTWVIGENVPGLVNWSGGVVFEEVQSDLEAEGYEVQSFILPAAGVGAPHRRDRVWIVAYSNKCTTGPSRTSAGTIGERSGNNDEPKERGKQTEQHFGHGNVYGTDSDTRLQRQTERQQQTMGSEQLCKKRATSNTKGEQDDGDGSRGFFSKPPGTYEQRVTSNPTSNRRLWNRSGFAPEKGQQQGFIQAGQLAGRLEGLCVQRDVTDTEGKQGKRMQSEQREFSQQRQRELRGVSSSMGCGDATDPSDTRLQGSEKFGGITRERQESYKQSAGRICTDWQNFPTQSPVCNGDDGISARLVRYILRTGGDCYTEEEAEKEAKRIISKVRAEGIKAGGNAIVHQVALQIFKSINEFEKISTL